MTEIDINCDVGEGIGNEDALFPLISSCNIACGGHAGDRESMTRVIQLAKKHGVKIGAHPSYPDRNNFGRKSMDLPAKEFMHSIQEQLSRFRDILKTENTSWHHIKPHGALYNDLARNMDLAQQFLLAIEPFINDLYLYVPYGSVLKEVAEAAGIKTSVEAFVDRNYKDDLSLVPRSEPNALISDPVKALEHLVTMVKRGKVRTITGQLIPLQAETFCIHGDTPSALQILAYLVAELPRQDIVIAK